MHDLGFQSLTNIEGHTPPSVAWSVWAWCEGWKKKKVYRDLAQPKGEAFPDPNVDSIDSNETTHPQTKPATYSLEIPASSTFLSGISSARSITKTKESEKLRLETTWSISNWKNRSLLQHGKLIHGKEAITLSKSSSTDSQQGSWCEMATTTEL